MVKRNFILAVLGCILLWTGCIGTAWAQSDWNPTNPADPYYNPYYKVTVTSEPAEAGNQSGAGKYLANKSITINTSAKSTDFVFKYWTLNGEEYSTAKSFSYTVTGPADFVAVYEKIETGGGDEGGGNGEGGETTDPEDPVIPVEPFDPVNPSDPNRYNKYRLYLIPNPDGSCSFNRTNGDKVEGGATVDVSALPNQYYEFTGWYIGEELISSELSFQYTMPEASITLEARFVYNNPNEGGDEGGNEGDDSGEEGDGGGEEGGEDLPPVDPFDPENPNDPYGTQPDIQNTEYILGDANNDGEVDIADVSTIVSYITGRPIAGFNENAADINKDNEIDISDVVLLVDIILHK